jgi:hypothetical protein
MAKGKKAPKIRLQCEWCELVRHCDGKYEFQERFTFTCLTDKPAFCERHEPRWYRGIEGCAA